MRSKLVGSQLAGIDMSPAASRLESEVAKLDPDECAELLHRLIEAVWTDAKVEQAWAREIEQRAAAFDRGEMSHQPASVVLASLRNRLR